MRLKNKFIVVVPVYNAGALVEPCISSILSQDYEDLGIVIRDDISTDDTFERVQKLVKGSKNVIAIKNKKKYFPVGNIYDSAMKFCNRDSVIGIVDGDDALCRTDAVSRIMQEYDNGFWMVWGQHITSRGNLGCSAPLPEVLDSREYWSASHFRTHRTELFYQLKKRDILDPFVPNSYYQYAGDAAYLFPFIEMCGHEKCKFINEVMYHYNDNLPTNEHNKSLETAIKYGREVRMKPLYSRLEEL